jgi:hypothetical protein
MTGSYFRVIKADPIRYEIELNIVKAILNDKYKNDEEYRETVKERSRLRQQRIRDEKKSIKE